MRLTLLGLMAAAAFSAAGARADSPVVVELFTSQGCSSCPPADELLGRLVKREDVIPLALHVDYWDYIGWADKFAKPAFTQRQKGYARALHSKTVYTPQMIIDGDGVIVGHRPMEVNERIARRLDEEGEVALEVQPLGDAVTIVARRLQNGERAYVVHLVRYDPMQTVEIERGENAGKTLTYYNIVTSWETIATWAGLDELALRREIVGDDPAVVIVQEASYGPIVAAARAR